MTLNRRDRSFKATVAGGAVVSGMGLGLGRAWASAAERRPASPTPGKIGDFKISLAEWSLHKALFAKKIDNLDFPKIAREQYGIEGVEFVNQFFKDKAHDSAYLKDLKTRADDHGVTCVLIMIDGEGDLSAPDKADARQGRREPQEVGRRRRGPRLPLDPGQHRRALQPDRRRRVAEACGALTEYGEQAQDQHHLREPRRPVEQPRRPARPDEGRGQADRTSAPCPTSATSPRTGTASTRSTSTTRSPG